MFTGLVETIGQVRTAARTAQGFVLNIDAPKFKDSLKRGDSIAVNGACLTVTEVTRMGFKADVMSVSLANTNLGRLQSGQKVNLERAVVIGSRIGGHIVSGHIDATGRVVDVTKKPDALLVGVSTPPDIVSFMCPKASVAVDGVSLTITAVTMTGFTVSLVEQTRLETTLGDVSVGYIVNLEVDILAKYAALALVSTRSTEKAIAVLTMERLAELGY